MGKGEKQEPEDEGIAPGLEEFEKALEAEGGVKATEPNSEDLIEDAAEGEAAKEGAEPVGDDEPTDGDEPALEAEPEGDKAEVVDDEPTPSAKSGSVFKVPDDSFYGDYRGKKMTAKQLEEAGLLDKILTGAHQVALYQRRYEESAEKLSKFEERLKAIETPPTPDEPQLTPEQFAAQVEHNFAPAVKDLEKEGLIESDYAAVYPKKAALDEFRVQAFINILDKVDKRLANVEKQVEPWSEQEQENRAINNVSSIVTSLIKEEDQLCGALASEKTQKEFFDYLSDRERSGIRFTPYDATKRDIRGAWLQFLMDEGRDIPVTKKGEPPKPKGQKGMTGTGGKMRGRGGAAPKGELDEFQQLEQAFTEAQEAKFE
jgi:hypothetical protein